MVSTINSGYLRKCKENYSGLEKIWLFPYVKYLRSQIVTNGNILTTYPSTTIYPFYSNGNPSANETIENEDGGKSYNQSISLQLDKVFNIEKLIRKDYSLIFKDRNGYFRIFGLYNGLEIDILDYTTGSGKSDFNGVSLTLKGKEEMSSFFIENLEDVGFFEEAFRILESGEIRALENNDLRILE